MKGNRILSSLFFLLLFSGVYFIVKAYVRRPLENPVSYTNNCFYVLSLKIPANLEFCGEKIPFNDVEIRNDLEREFYSDSYWKSNSKVLFNKAQRWFPVIEPILKREGIPDDFKYLAVIESHLGNVSSPASAAGFWQLVPVTAYNYGLEIDQYVDERYDVEKSTVAACRLIKESYAILKNWTLCAAAYNLGIGGIVRALEAQKTTSYYDLLLNSETGSFVYRVLAYKTLFSDPAHFGIKRKKMTYAARLPFKTFKVDSNVTSLANLANHMGSDYGTLKLFNPWLVSSSLGNASGKTYEFRLPKPGVDYTGYLADVSPFRTIVEQDEILKQKSDSLVVAEKTIHYVVRVTEPVSNLAKFFKVEEEDIRKWNNLPPGEMAVAGMTLVLYVK